MEKIEHDTEKARAIKLVFFILFRITKRAEQ